MDKTSLEKMLAHDNDNPLLRFTLANIYLKEGDPEQAVPHIEIALKQNRNHSASWKTYGKALAAAGETERAIDAYKEGIEVAESPLFLDDFLVSHQ